MCILYENTIWSLGSPLMKILSQVQQPGFLRSYLVPALSSIIRRTPSLFSLPAFDLQCPPQLLHLLNHSWQLCSTWHLSLIPNYRLVKKKYGAVASLVLLTLLRGLGRKWAAELRAALCYQGVWACLFYYPTALMKLSGTYFVWDLPWASALVWNWSMGRVLLE